MSDTSQVTTARGAGLVAALTFDDGPNPGETDELLDFLAEVRVRAVFCVIGADPRPGRGRAPNGSWGRTAGIAAELAMRPLGLGNVIFDRETQDEETLVAHLRAAVVPGAVVLAHDGGGERWSTVRAVRRVVSERLADGWSFTLPAQ